MGNSRRHRELVQLLPVVKIIGNQNMDLNNPEYHHALFHIISLQVEADLDMSQHPPEAVDFSLLSARLAAGLSAVLLPPLPSPVPAHSAPSRARSRAGKMSVNMPVPRREPKRPSLR